jgi:hypothetical protein
MFLPRAHQHNPAFAVLRIDEYAPRRQNRRVILLLRGKRAVESDAMMYSKGGKLLPSSGVYTYRDPTRAAPRS